MTDGGLEGGEEGGLVPFRAAEAFGGGARELTLPPDVPADMLGALLGGLVDGALPQSDSETVGEDAVDVLPFERDSSLVWVIFGGGGATTEEAAKESFVSSRTVVPGCFSYALLSGGGIGILVPLMDFE